MFSPMPAMDIDESITVTKINIQDIICYLMIGWQEDCFEMFLFVKDKLWKGKFSSNRLTGFSKNLHMSKEEYFKGVKNCLTQAKKDYVYELKSGFFYWKRKLKEGNLVIEGFLPVETDTSPKKTQPDLIEILMSLNTQLKDKVNNVKCKFRTVMADYQKCLKDTEEFLSLKVEMEKTLSDKFLTLLKVQKSKANSLDKKSARFGIVSEMLNAHEIEQF